MVRAADGNAAMGHIPVELDLFTGGRVATTVTNNEGEFSFINLNADTYEIVVDEEGYQPLRQSVQVTRMSSAQTVAVYLRRAQGNISSPGPAKISAQELALPEDVDKDYQQGITELYQKHDWEASLRLFARVITKAPNFYRAYYHTGVADRKLGRDEAAEMALKRAVELSDGRYGGLLVELASLLVDEKKFTEAEKMARQGLTVWPGYWTANYELARALMGQRREAEAEKSMQEAVTSHPDIPKAYLFLANIHINRKDKASLVKDLDNYLRLVPAGLQSDKAREMRDQAMKDLAQAKSGPSAPTSPQL